MCVRFGNMITRHAIRADLPAMTEIYNFYVLDGAVTFDIEPRTVADRSEWFDTFSADSPYQLLVVEEAGTVVGFAGSQRFKTRAAYRTSIETTIYLTANTQRRGVGTLLYSALFSAIAPFDLHRAYAGVTLPNDASVALHRKFGFTPIGVYKEVGRKFGRYWDVQWFEKALN